MARRIWTVLLLFFPSIDSAVGEDGLCTLFTFVPFTSNGTTNKCLNPRSKCSNAGFSYMASALMAIDHFNARNDTVVPELNQSIFQECPIKFNINTSLVLNSDSTTHLAAKNLYAQSEIPCAVAGPFHDIPALELSTMATTARFPVTVARAFNARVVSDFFSPHSTQIFPDIFEHSKNFVDFLLLQNRTDFVATLYPLTDTGLQRAEALAISMEARSILNRAFGYLIPVPEFHLSDDEQTLAETRAIDIAVRNMKNSGFRTIVVTMENPKSELPPIAAAAVKMGLCDGDHYWTFFGIFEPDLLYEEEDSDIFKCLLGSVWVAPLDSDEHDGEVSSFEAAWHSRDEDDVARLNAVNPIRPDEPGYFFAESDFFQEHSPDYGSGYMYDAVMATGMGACLSIAGGKNITVEAFVKGIRANDFEGATGRIKFGQTEGTDGARFASTERWGVLNLYPFKLTHTRIDGVWRRYSTFLIPGRKIPPDLLRDEPEQNYLDSGIRVLGFTLMGIAIFAAIVSAIWVFVNRKHRVLCAAQPYFLYLLSFGSVVYSSAIVTISFDESHGWSEDQLNSACMATPWLLCMGHVITYGALFSKLWRVNRVLQFSRRKIEIRHVAWPSVFFTLAAILVLSLWTALDPLRWNREEINQITGESIAECDSKNVAAFIAPLVAILLFPTILTAIMAWKTKDVDEVYSEASWIFSMILVHLEVIVIALPMIAILRDVSTSGRYIGFVCILWIFPMSTLALIMLPKVVAYRRAVRGIEKTKDKRGGSHGEVKVSGIETKKSQGSVESTGISGSMELPNRESDAMNEKQ